MPSSLFTHQVPEIAVLLNADTWLTLVPRASASESLTGNGALLLLLCATSAACYINCTPQQHALSNQAVRHIICMAHQPHATSGSATAIQSWGMRQIRYQSGPRQSWQRRLLFWTVSHISRTPDKLRASKSDGAVVLLRQGFLQVAQFAHEHLQRRQHHVLRPQHARPLHPEYEHVLHKGVDSSDTSWSKDLVEATAASRASLGPCCQAQGGWGHARAKPHLHEHAG